MDYVYSIFVKKLYFYMLEDVKILRGNNILLNLYGYFSYTIRGIFINVEMNYIIILQNFVKLVMSQNVI